jgi:hypothetical protein
MSQKCHQQTHAAATIPRLLVDRDHYGSSHLPDGLREVPLPVHIFDQNNFTDPDDASFPITRRNFVGRIQVDDVLTSRRGVPIEKPIGRRRAEVNSGRR